MNTENGTHVYFIIKLQIQRFLKSAKTFTIMATKKNNQLIKVHEHDIFTIIEDTNKKQFKIACGDALVCEKEFKTLKEAKEHCDKKDWSLMTNVMCYLFDKLAQMHTNQLKQQKHETEQKVLAESK